ITVHHPDDMRTVNEVFARSDYAASSAIRAVVDIGSNIGGSALYFLTRNRDVRCYLYEPDPRNTSRRQEHLATVEPRYKLEECAVSEIDGVVDFGIEPTGRYGGINAKRPETIRVRSREINSVLEEVLDYEAEIDILKLDTEGAEERTLKAI